MAGIILSLLLSHMHVAHYHRVPVRHHQVRVVQHKAKAPTTVAQARPQARPRAQAPSQSPSQIFVAPPKG
jgi:hypothetical protein